MFPATEVCTNNHFLCAYTIARTLKPNYMFPYTHCTHCTCNGMHYMLMVVPEQLGLGSIGNFIIEFTEFAIIVYIVAGQW